MKSQKDKTYTNPNRRKMSVDVAASFKNIQQMNEKAIAIVSKRM